jgi:hypothetical protein
VILCTPSHEALELLKVIGTQDLASRGQRLVAVTQNASLTGMLSSNVRP